MLKSKDRLLWGLGLLMVCMTTVSGCALFVPSRPLTSVPISLTVLDDQIAWHSCFDDAVEIEYFSVAVQREAGGEDLSELLYSGEMDQGAGYVSLAPDVTFVPSEDLSQMPVLAEAELNVSTLDGSVSVFLSIAGPVERADMVFERIDASELVEGNFFYPSGGSGTQPCDLPTE